nr:ATP synthase F0 sector subunit b [uncultured bacterium]
MNRLFALILIGCVSLCAQERPEKTGEVAVDRTAEKAGKSAHEGEHGGMELWKWANFVLLVGALGYMVGKNAGPFFAGRSRQIRKDMIESEEMRKQAEARVAEVDRRLANLEKEIAALRDEARLEADAETERLARHTAAEIAKVQMHAEQDIQSAGKAARAELKRYSAELAIALAEQKIRTRINPDAQNAMVMAFVRDLDKPESQAQAI